MKLLKIFIVTILIVAPATSTKLKCGIAADVCRYNTNGEINPASLTQYQPGMVCNSKHHIETFMVDDKRYACCKAKHPESGN